MASAARGKHRWLISWDPVLCGVTAWPRIPRTGSSYIPPSGQAVGPMLMASTVASEVRPEEPAQVRSATPVGRGLQGLGFGAEEGVWWGGSREPPPGVH